MTTSTATPPSATPDRVVGRIGLAYPGQTSLLAELGGDPQTLGCGPKCTIRLSGSGIRPLHCVVTTKGDDRVARSWAPGTQLNGSEFTEATLSAGDLLRIGSIDIQVVELPEDEAVEAVDPVNVLSEAPASDTTEPPAAVESEAKPATPDSFNWVDDSVAEVEQAIARAAEAENGKAANFDPAVPGHLLKPWMPADGSTPIAPRDTASSIVELNDFATDQGGSASEDAAAPVVEPAPEPAPAEPAEEPTDEWSVAPSAPTAKPESLSADPTSASAWEAEYTEIPEAEADPVTADPAPLLESGAVAPLAIEPTTVEPSDVEPQALEHEGEAVVTPAAESDWARLRRRADRERVARLVGTLREHRQRLTTLEATIAERDATIQESRPDLAAAIGAADQAATELARLAETTERLEATESELSEARQQIVALEQRLADLEAIETTVPAVEEANESVVAPEQVAEPVAEAVEEAAASEEAPAAEEASPRLGESLWAASEPPAAEGQPELSEAPASEGSSPPESLQERGDAWGIEQLVDTPADEEGALWNGLDEVALPGEEPIAQPPQDLAPAVEQAAGPVDSEEALLAPASNDDPPAEILFGTPSEPDVEGLAPAELIHEETALEEATLGIEPAAEETAWEEPAAEADQSSLLSEPEATGEQPAPLAAFQPKPSEPAAEGAGPPASFIEQYAHMLPDEDAPVEAITPVEPPALNETPDPEPQGGEGDESIDDYMRKLMQRVRGEAEPASAAESIAPSTPAAQATKAVVEAPACEVPVAPAPEPANEKAEPIRCLSELKTGGTANQSTDLNSLRQIANQSARHALDVASTKQSREQAVLRLTGAAIALGFGVLAIVTASSPFAPQFAVGVLGAAGGGWFGVRTLRACQMASREEEMAAVAKGTPIA